MKKDIRGGEGTPSEGVKMGRKKIQIAKIVDERNRQASMELFFFLFVEDEDYIRFCTTLIMHDKLPLLRLPLQERGGLLLL